jgi:gluconokinase
VGLIRTFDPRANPSIDIVRAPVYRPVSSETTLGPQACIVFGWSISWQIFQMSNSQNTEGRLSILAIDIGSSSSRTEVFDSQLRPVPHTFAQRTYQLITGGDGKAELDPIRLFETICACIRESIKQTHRIDCIGISCFWHSILGVDSQFLPMTGVLMWADTRAAGAVERLGKTVNPETHHQVTGTRLHTSYPMAKLRWLNDDHPDVVAKTSFWMSFPEYLQYRLAGTLSVSTSMASGTGFFDRKTLDWSSDALSHAELDNAKLSPLSDEPITVSDAGPLPGITGATWIPSIGDGAANNLGSHALSASHPALMVGTTGALRLVTTEPPDRLPSRLWQYRLDQEHALLGGALSEGGGVIAWLMDNLNAPDHGQLEQVIAFSEPDEHGLTVLPYLAGERSPNWHSDAVGTIHGLRFDTQPVDIVQATMESIGYSFAAILDDLNPLLQEPVEIIATGNALRLNRTWIQMIADISGYTLLLPRKTESSLRGAALHALRQIGENPPIPDIQSDSDRFEPRAERAPAYARARERQAELYKLLIAHSD